MGQVEQPIEVRAGLEITAAEGSRNGEAPATEGTSGEAQAAAKVCVPCLIARVVLLAVATGLLVWAILEERKRATSDHG